jgi:hypothetical protein
MALGFGMVRGHALHEEFVFHRDGVVERQGHREVIPFRYTEILTSGYDRILSRQLAIMDRIERIHQHPRLQECLRSILFAACRHY